MRRSLDLLMLLAEVPRLPAPRHEPAIMMIERDVAFMVDVGMIDLARVERGVLGRRLGDVRFRSLLKRG